MLPHRTKWRSDRGARALRRLADIEASIAALTNEDLLDLADIFADDHHAPLGVIAATEMSKRKISL